MVLAVVDEGSGGVLEATLQTDQGFLGGCPVRLVLTLGLVQEVGPTPDLEVVVQHFEPPVIFFNLR